MRIVLLAIAMCLCLGLASISWAEDPYGYSQWASTSMLNAMDSGFNTQAAPAETLNSAIASYRSGQIPQAQQQLMQLLDAPQRLSSNDQAIAHYYMGLCYAKSGQTAMAQSEYQTVLNLNPPTKLGELAQKGLDILQQSQWDEPPVPGAAATQTPATDTNKMMEMMMMMSMMGGGSNGSGGNMMMMPLMQEMMQKNTPQGASGQNRDSMFSPEMMSQIMQQQMMQDMGGLFDSGDKNR